MGSSSEPRHVAQVLLSELGLDVVSCKELQSLWAGYGHICAVVARPSPTSASSSGSSTSQLHERRFSESVGDGGGSGSGSLHLILKLISPPTRHGDEGHLRKMLSYEVEQYFYDEVAPAMAAGEDDGGPAVAVCLASTRRRARGEGAEALGDDLIAMVMTDLRPEYPIAGEKRATLDARQARAALEWLARFHSGSWKLLKPPGHLDPSLLLPPLQEEARRKQSGKAARTGKGLWLNGGYTYLATRRKEYAALVRDGSSEWSATLCKPLNSLSSSASSSTPSSSTASSSIAELVADFLTPRGRPFETYIHGDVKSENLFATAAGDRVAFFDFQYAGVGLGVCDLAKLFTCSVPLYLLTDRPSIPHGPGGRLPMGDGERELLDDYRETLLARRPRAAQCKGDNEHGYPWDTFVRHWEAALVDWCRFQASWGFWGNTEWLQARVRSILADEGWREWLLREAETAAAA
ncbi:pig-p domain-containing protein [Purpureocillium lavendulum]|uniref:Pig-p domain-containing protein n=1 Tax=Purpureocillium lavendulum TaxID=1247861 RepID=A0AB34FGQ8_9HYPO|nr:pig-p domain-containing protein [Purpureocillium lavendulum]